MNECEIIANLLNSIRMAQKDGFCGLLVARSSDVLKAESYLIVHGWTLSNIDDLWVR